MRRGVTGNSRPSCPSSAPCSQPRMLPASTQWHAPTCSACCIHNTRVWVYVCACRKHRISDVDIYKLLSQCYAPTYSEATTEPCSWTPIYPTNASDFHWAGYRSGPPLRVWLCGWLGGWVGGCGQRVIFPQNTPKVLLTLAGHPRAGMHVRMCAIYVCMFMVGYHAQVEHPGRTHAQLSGRQTPPAWAGFGDCAVAAGLH